MQNEYKTLADALRAFCEAHFELVPSSRVIAKKIKEVHGVTVSHALVCKVLDGADSPTLRKVFGVRKYPDIRTMIWRGTPEQAEKMKYHLKNQGYKNLQHYGDRFLVECEQWEGM